jgi:hypothetical protein
MRMMHVENGVSEHRSFVFPAIVWVREDFSVVAGRGATCNISFF